jgi:hypothetical protein
MPFLSGLQRATLMAGDDTGGEHADRTSHWKRRIEVLMRLMKKLMILSVGGGVLVTGGRTCGTTSLRRRFDEDGNRRTRPA